MPAPPFPEPIVQPGSGLTFAWAWMTRQQHQANWGGAGQRVVERMIVFWDDYVDYTVQSELCGYCTVDAGGDFNRVLPWPHPAFPQLFIDEDQGISAAEYKGRGFKTLATGKAPYVQYTYVILTLVFTERRYLVAQGIPGNELIAGNPFLEFVDKGTAEYIQLQSGSYGYDPNNAQVQAAGLQNKPFPQGLAVRDPKDTLTMIWHLVPQNWLHNGQGIAINILAALGTVNLNPFLNFNPGALYFDSHDKIQKSYPIAPVGGDVTTTWAWNVTLYFKYRAPFTQVPQGPGTSYDLAGHNLVPAPQNPSGGWLPAKAMIGGTPAPGPQPGPPAGGTATGVPLFVASDFNIIFQQAPG